MAEQNTGFLCNKFTRFALPTGSSQENRELTLLLPSDLLAIPETQRNLAWLAHGIYKARAYRLNKEVMEAVDRLAYNPSAGREWFSDILGYRPEFYTPPFPLMWIEWTNLRFPDVKEGFLLEQLPSGEPGVVATYFADGSKDGLVPSANHHICSYVLRPTADHDQGMQVYRQFKPLQFPDRTSEEARKKAMSGFIGHTHLLNTILVFLKSQTPILKLIEPEGGGRQKDIMAKISRGKSSYREPGTIALDVSHISGTQKTTDENEAKRLMVEQIVSGRWAIVNDAFAGPKGEKEGAQATTLFHVSTSGEPNGILTHIGTFPTALQHLDGLFGLSATRKYDGYSYSIFEKSNWNAQQSAWGETEVRRETPQQMIGAYASFLSNTTIYEVAIPNRKPLVLNDCWELDPIGSGGLAIFNGNTDLSEKERAELSEIFQPFDKPIYLKDVQQLISEQRLQQMEVELQGDPVFKDHLTRRESKYGKDQITHNLAVEIVWAYLTMRVRNWAIENGYDTLVYKNYKEGDGQLTYVTLNEGSVEVIRRLNFDPQNYLNEAIPVIGRHARKLWEQYTKSGKSESVVPKQFWNMIDTGKYWLSSPLNAAPAPTAQTATLASSETLESDRSDLLLNSILSRFAKIELLKTNNMIPIFGDKRFISDKNGTRIGRLLDQTHKNLASAAPYQYSPDAISSVVGGKDLKISNGIILPSPITWIDNCAGESDKTSGALLVDDGNGVISVTLFLDPPPGYNQKTHMERHNIRLLEQVPPLAPFLEQFSAMGEYKDTLLIVPNIIFDTKTNSVRFRDRGTDVLPMFVENIDRYPWITNYSEITARLNKNTLRQLSDGWLATAKVSLQLAQALASNNPKLKFESSPEPTSVDLTVLAGFGKAPIRTASVVELNPDFVEQNPSVDEANPTVSPSSEEFDVSKKHTPDISLADFVIETGRNATGYWRDTTRPIGGALIPNPKRGRYGAKRFVLDKDIQEIVDQTYCVPFEDFAAQYKRIATPFEPMWFETTVFEKYREQSAFSQRGGVLVKWSGDAIVARTVRETIDPTDSSAEALELHEREVRQLGKYVRDGRAVSSDDVELILNDDKLMAYGGEHINRVYKTTIDKKPDTENLQESLVERSIIEAQFFFRFFVLISCQNVKTNVWEIQNDETRVDALPTISHQVQVELSYELKMAFETRDVEAIKRLLGWAVEPSPTLTGEIAQTEEGPQIAAVFTSVVAAEDSNLRTNTVAPVADLTPATSVLTEEELRERETKRQEAFEEAKVRLLADAEMYLAQAQNRELNRFECRIVLNKPGFPIQLQFSKEMDTDGEKKTSKAAYTLDGYDQLYAERSIPLTMNDAVDLKIIVQSMICNADGIIPIHDPSVSGQRAVELDTQMPLPILNHKVIQRSGGMYTLIFDARDPYTREIIHPSIPLGLAARHEDREAEKCELNDRVEYVIDYLVEKDNQRTPEGHRIYVTKRDVLMKLQSHLEEQNKLWVTAERITLPGFNTNTLIYVSSQSDQKVTLAPVALHMDVGGDNPTWHCDLTFFIGNKNKAQMGERVRRRNLNLHTSNQNLAVARSLETLVGVSGKSGQLVEGFLRHLQKHMHTTGNEWCVENKGTQQEEVIIGNQPLQYFLDDMMRYEHDIGIKLDTHQADENGNATITIQALRSLTGDFGRTAQFLTEYVYESEGDERKPIAFTLTVPRDKNDRIEQFVKAAHEHVRWHADEAYSSVALGSDGQDDKRKTPLGYRAAQVRLSIIRAVEELFQEHFDMRLPKNWHGRDKQQASSPKSPKREKSLHDGSPSTSRDDFPIG